MFFALVHVNVRAVAPEKLGGCFEFADDGGEQRSPAGIRHRVDGRIPDKQRRHGGGSSACGCRAEWRGAPVGLGLDVTAFLQQVDDDRGVAVQRRKVNRRLSIDVLCIRVGLGLEQSTDGFFEFVLGGEVQRGLPEVPNGIHLCSMFQQQVNGGQTAVAGGPVERRPLLIALEVDFGSLVYEPLHRLERAGPSGVMERRVTEIVTGVDHLAVLLDQCLQ